MREVDGEIIKSAIARNIKKNITLDKHSSFKIYKEKVIQNASKPCFFIWAMDVSQTKLMNDNYQRTYQMNIRLELEDDASKVYEQLSEVGNKLLLSLARIEVPIMISETEEVNRVVRGTQMSFNIVDEVLQLFVTYNIKIKQVSSKLPIMETLKIQDN